MRAFVRLRIAFDEKNHSIICRELLIDADVTPGGEPETRTKAYYERRPCGCYVEDAALILAVITLSIQSLTEKSRTGGQRHADLCAGRYER